MIRTDEFETRLRALVFGDGMTFATPAASGAADRDVFTATIAARFDAGRRYSERDVNVRLKAWLAGVGANVETDRVTRRRWLVDTGVVARSGDCAEYRLEWLATGPDVAEAAAGAESIAADARSARDAARASRKEAWLARTAGDGSFAVERAVPREDGPGA